MHRCVRLIQAQRQQRNDASLEAHQGARSLGWAVVEVIRMYSGVGRVA